MWSINSIIGGTAFRATYVPEEEEELVIGEGEGESGGFTLKPQYDNVTTVVVGDSGTGTFNQEGGTATITALEMGVNTGSSGTYDLVGGTMNLGGATNGAGDSTLNVTEAHLT